MPAQKPRRTKPSTSGLEGRGPIPGYRDLVNDPGADNRLESAGAEKRLRVLAHLGLSPPEESKPAPSVHDIVRVPVDEEGREMEAS